MKWYVIGIPETAAEEGDPRAGCWEITRFPVVDRVHSDTPPTPGRHPRPDNTERHQP